MAETVYRTVAMSKLGDAEIVYRTVSSWPADTRGRGMAEIVHPTVNLSPADARVEPWACSVRGPCPGLVHVRACPRGQPLAHGGAHQSMCGRAAGLAAGAHSSVQGLGGRVAPSPQNP